MALKTPPEYVRIEDAEVRAETTKAILVASPRLFKEEWIPKSVIHDDSEVWKMGQAKGLVFVAEWFMDTNGIPIRDRLP